jgi:hypothetical protein
LYPETPGAGIAVQDTENPVDVGLPVMARPLGVGGRFCICRGVDGKDVSVVPPLLYIVLTVAIIGLLKVNEGVIFGVLNSSVTVPFVIVKI